MSSGAPIHTAGVCVHFLTTGEDRIEKYFFFEILGGKIIFRWIFNENDLKIEKSIEKPRKNSLDAQIHTVNAYIYFLTTGEDRIEKSFFSRDFQANIWNFTPLPIPSCNMEPNGRATEAVSKC